MKSVVTAAVFLASAHAAQALSIDFTDRSVWNSASSTTTVAGATVSLSSTGGTVNFTQNFDGDKAGVCIGFGGPLACKSDGAGVNDDEISTAQIVETLTVRFSQSLAVTGVSFLDLFLSSDQSELERAEVYFNDDLSTLVSFAAQQVIGTKAGFAQYMLPWIIADSMTFRAAASNDKVGVADFALASIEVSAVPLPAAGWMLIAGVGALAAAGRARRATA
jgi:hypothetical protein